MFECSQCHKTFTRKDSLLRHIKTLHPPADARNFSSNHHNMSITNQFENTTGQFMFNPLDKQMLNDEENKALSVQESLESNYDVDVTGRNDIVEDVSQVLQNNNENYIAEKGLNTFDQRVHAAAEAIKSKFNALRKSRNVFENYKSEIPVSKDEEEAAITKNICKDNNVTTFEAKLPELLQCMLDILMIKELQNVDITDRNDEKNNGDKNDGVKLKRSFNSVDEQHNNDDEIMSSGEISFKRLKYDNSMKNESDDNSSLNSECDISNYWHNANTIVDNLRKLMRTTKTGQQIFAIMKTLNESRNPLYTNRCLLHNKQQNKLIQNLNELKKTKIGRKIFCILQELEQFQIIESPDFVADEEEEHLSDEDDDYI